MGAAAPCGRCHWGEARTLVRGVPKWRRCHAGAAEPPMRPRSVRACRNGHAGGSGADERREEEAERMRMGMSRRRRKRRRRRRRTRRRTRGTLFKKKTTTQVGLENYIVGTNQYSTRERK